MKNNTPDKSGNYTPDVHNISDFFEFMDNSHRGFSKIDYEKARSYLHYRINILEMEKASKEDNAFSRFIEELSDIRYIIIFSWIFTALTIYVAITHPSPDSIAASAISLIISAGFLALAAKAARQESNHYVLRFSYKENEKKARRMLNLAEKEINQIETEYGPFPKDSDPYKKIKSIRFSLKSLEKSNTIGLDVQLASVIHNRASSLKENLNLVDHDQTARDTNKLKDVDPVHIEPVTVPAEPVDVPAEPTLSPIEEYNRIIDEYLFMEMSPSTVIEAPLLLDVTFPELEEFHEQRSIADLEKARGSTSEKFRIEVKKLDDLWIKALDKAYAIGLNGLNRAEKRRAHHLLDQIIYAVNDNESENAKRSLLALIDKITYVTDNGTVRHVNINHSHILDKVFTKEITA